MSYRNILVHLNDSRRARRLLLHASRIARAFDARLTALHVSPAMHGRKLEPLNPYVPMLDDLKFSLDEEGDHIRTIFAEVTGSERFTGELRTIVTERSDPADVVISRARAADLVIASQADRAWRPSSLLDFPERLALESGRPVLVVPNVGDHPALPKAAIVAWNQSREAARAMHDALPLLKGAETVELLTLEEPRIGGPIERQLDEAALPASVVAQSLAEHGLKPTVVALKSSGSGGHDICDRALRQRADLVVMGAYGHSRLRELILGGATREVLASMSVPTFFSH